MLPKAVLEDEWGGTFVYLVEVVALALVLPEVVRQWFRVLFRGQSQMAYKTKPT